MLAGQRRPRETSSGSSEEGNPCKATKISNEVFLDSANEVPSNAQMYKTLLEIQSNASKIL